MKTENNGKAKYESLSKGLGITGLVLGIVTLLVSFIPCFGLFAIFFGIIAISISLIGLVIALKHNHEKGLIVGALIASLLGCGIAYSQYAAINALGDELVKEANKTIVEYGGEPIDYKKKGSDIVDSGKEKTDSNLRKEDVELVKTYMSNSKKELTDKDGFAMNYEYELKWGNSKSLGKTETIFNEGTYANSMFLDLSISEAYVDLKLNGEHMKTIKFISHIYNLNVLNPHGSNPIPDYFTKTKLIYTPDLDGVEVKKEIIKKVTTPFFYQSGAIKDDNDKKQSNKWINVSSKLIKDSNISDMNYLTKIDKEIFKTPKETRVINDKVEDLEIEKNDTTNEAYTKTYKGSIGNKYPITMKLTITSNVVDGFYYYDKIGTQISLKGSVNKDTIEINEFDTNNTLTGTFTGKLDDNKIVGQWLKGDRSTILKFQLKAELKPSKEEEIFSSLIITVDNLRVRTSPDLDAEKIENLPIDTEVEFLNDKSEGKTIVTIKGNEINEYWYKIKTPSGNVGWIHGCCFDKN